MTPLVDAEPDPYATAGAISSVLRVPLSTVHRWAREDAWSRTDNRRRPVLYRYDDACKSYGRRRVAA